VKGPLENYRILGLLGRGSSGQVFHALNPDGQEVAVKRIPFAQEEWPDVNQPVETLRSLYPPRVRPRQLGHDLVNQRVETLCSLHHPYLLKTLACHIAANELWLVTELADGDLHQWLKQCQGEGRAGVPVYPLLGYLGDSAEALDYLRAHGTPHRNLKPSNLLRLRGQARVTGFIPWRDPSHQGSLVGTPAYLSPEEWQGMSSAASDQYKLTVIYCEMRMGRRPFAGTSPLELALEHFHGEPNLGPLPEAERRVLQRALARQPERRYSSCAEMVRELKRAVTGECVRTHDRPYRLDSSWLRWNDGCVAKLARAIDEDGRFEDVPILGDAFEDAGCADAEILEHCRQPGEHVRGCWVLELILGKERQHDRG
jgi:serine/threonine protein kinase